MCARLSKPLYPPINRFNIEAVLARVQRHLAPLLGSKYDCGVFCHVAEKFCRIIQKLDVNTDHFVLFYIGSVDAEEYLYRF
jgi:hypothetical protein